MADPAAVKRALARLAIDGADDANVVARAVACVDDLSAAAAFAESGGVDRLRRTLETRPDPDPDGERALRAFECYRAACRSVSPRSRKGFTRRPEREGRMK